MASGSSSEGLLQVEWIAPSGSPARDEERIAVLGDLEPGDLNAERFPDLESLAAAGAVPPLVLARCSAAGAQSSSPPQAALANAALALELLQGWLAEDRLAASRLCLLTRGAMAVVEGEAADPAEAALWGMVRSAQAEHPGRFCLIDVGPELGSSTELSAAIAIAADEPQLAIRDGAALVPRLAPLDPPSEELPGDFDPDRTVLICDGQERLGTLIATHLAVSRGVRHIMLVQIDEREEAPQLPTQLAELGEGVRVEGWDPGDRDRMRQLIDSVDSDHPVGAVVHAARVLDDGVIESLDRERLERALLPRTLAAWQLHELTRELDLSRFLLVSCAAGTVGSAAQANYAAANTFLDALAAGRHAQGLPAMALAWGPVGAGQGSREMDDAMRARLGRTGLLPFSPERALGQLDAALLLERPFVAPIDLDRGALRAQARLGTLPAVLHDLAPASSPRERVRGTLAERLAAVPDEEREKIALEAVREDIAVVLGHGSGKDVEPGRPFQELGFDSLSAVELRNRLDAATGMRLPPTLAFDYPTPAALAGYLAAHCGGDGAGAPEEAIESALASLTEALAQIEELGGARERVAMRLRAAVASFSAEEQEREEVLAEDLAAMSDDEVFALIDEEVGDG